MAESQNTEAGDVKTAKDAIKMATSDKQKFDALVDLIRGGQVSNQEVVDAVLNLVSKYQPITIKNRTTGGPKNVVFLV